jgi:hypothetical protein
VSPSLPDSSGKAGEEVRPPITNMVCYVKKNRAAIVPFAPLRLCVKSLECRCATDAWGLPHAKAQRDENHEPRKTSLQTKRGNPEEISALSPLSLLSPGHISGEHVTRPAARLPALGLGVE